MSALPGYFRLRLAQRSQAHHRPRFRGNGPYFPFSCGRAKAGPHAGCRCDGRSRSPSCGGASAAKDVWVQSDARNPFCDEPPILPCCHGLTNPPAAGEQKMAWHLAGRLEVVVNGLARLLRQLEADWTPGLSLAHRRTSERVSVRGNVFDLHRDDIAASQLAINGEIEHCQLADSPFDLKLRPNGPDVPCQQRRFRPD